MHYLEKHPNLHELDKEAIEATIMDALVYKGLIDPNKESLDLDSLCIVDNINHYRYQEHPNISGIPLWMKEKFRKKSIRIAASMPVSLCLAKPAGPVHYCVYDPNTAVSSIFEDACFYEAIYDSPTRGVRLTRSRPFVEVDINGEPYLVDVLTKRIPKTSWFKEEFNMEITWSQRISELSDEQRKYYDDAIQEENLFAEAIDLIIPLVSELPGFEEYRYEIEQSKKNFPEDWQRAEQLTKERKAFFAKSYLKTPISKD